MNIIDIWDYFGSTYVKEHGNDVVIGGIKTSSLIHDMDTVWKNSRLPGNMFKSIKRHRLIVDRFFLPDVKYVLSQIMELKQRKSNKYRLKQLIKLIDTETWMKSTIEPHEDILDFSQLKNLKHTLFDHQVNTLKVYNEKVPKMKLRGFLLSTPPGCLTGDHILTLKRHNEKFNMFLDMACKCYNQDGTEYQNWDVSIPTYIRAYVNGAFQYHEIHSIVYCKDQPVYKLKLADGKHVICTQTHLIMSQDGYIYARDCVGKMIMVDDRFNRQRLSYQEAISFEYAGIQETYDVICREPWHNFIASDVVVHNSGKTIMSIALSQCLHADLSIYIVPKNTVTTVWFDGIRDELGDKARIWASSHDEPITDDYDHYIFHYEALPLAIFLAKRLVNKRKIPFIAIDESHNLNEISSIRTLRLVELTKILSCQHTVFASGTPIKALGVEAIPLLRCIDPFFSTEVELRFKAIYGLTAKRAVDILRNRLGLISHKIPEDSYMTAPKPIEKELFIKAPGAEAFTIKNIKTQMTKFMNERYTYYQNNMKQYIRIFNQGLSEYERTLRTSQERADLRLYKEHIKTIIEAYNPIAHQEIARWTKEFEQQKIIPVLPQSIRKSFKDSISVVKYTKARTLGESLGWLSGKRAECSSLIAKYANLESYILDADKKTIIFSSYVETVKTTNEILVKSGFKTLQVYGDYAKVITEIVAKFKTDPSYNPIIATYKSLSASQTLTVANVVLFLDVPFRDYTREQALHRAYRIGQDTQTYLFSFFLDTGSELNLSTRADEILKWSQSQIQSLFGGMDKNEAEGIVKRLHLNPHTGLDTFMDMFKKVKLF